MKVADKALREPADSAVPPHERDFTVPALSFMQLAATHAYLLECERLRRVPNRADRKAFVEGYLEEPTHG